ncbi:helix-turn-helix domain-containing protein [Pelagibacteraceae bacterium]|nr:helix-turn-helix domain-containing protein [Pelagibacteraceae bacterium]
MKNRLNIISNKKIKNFLISFLSEYKLTFTSINEIDYKLLGAHLNIIFIINREEFNIIEHNKINDNYLIISNLKNKNLDLNNKINYFSAPLSIISIKNKIENFLNNQKITFHDIYIENEKIINLSNNSFCYLTKVELEILCFLIKEKETNKDFIKENILNIKSNIETNSLESHLTRIRKKLNKINTGVKLQTKSEKLIITI